MIIGYARTSTVDQVAGLEAQTRELMAAGCEKMFVEQVSSVDVAQRDQLALALDFLREGDTLVVTKLDRLARSVTHMHSLVQRIDQKHAALRVLGMDIDTRSPTGKLMIAILGGVAEFEREIMLERQREGIAKAKCAGKYKGRVPTAQRKRGEIETLLASGIGATEVAKKLGISRASVYNVRKKIA